MHVQVVASKAGDLVGMLKEMETLCEAIGTFWELEADRFSVQGQKMIANETHYAKMKPLLKTIAKKDIPFWQKSKDDFNTYADVMTQVMMTFNFTTDAKLPPTKEFKCGKLDFILHIPKDVDIKKIMGK